MSNKRKRSEETATGVTTGANDNFDLRRSQRGQELLRSIKDALVTVRHPHSTDTWTIHEHLLRQSCAMLNNKQVTGAALEVTLPEDESAAACGLSVQWLYSGSYHEDDSQVEEFLYASNSFDNLTLIPITNRDDGGERTPLMSWSIKAPILAWNLGKFMRAKQFQDYALRRLFAALSRPSTTLLLTFKTVKFVLSKTKPFEALQRLLIDVILRNWGDATIVTQTSSYGWFQLFRDHPCFLRTFIPASMKSLEDRQQQILTFERYLLPSCRL